MSFRRRWRALDEELQSHARLAAADGRPPGSRDRAPDATREAVRDQWAWRWLDDAGRDLRFGARGLRRSPGFTLAAVATLALGIGAATAMFSLVNTILLRPLPYPHPQQLMTSNQYFPQGAYVFFRNRLRTVDLAAYGDPRSFHLLLPGGRAQVTPGSATAANFFAVLGVKPALGSGFSTGADEPGRGREVVLSHQLWLRDFHADPAIVGRTLMVDGEPHAIVGVMPAGFRFPAPDVRLWVPLQINPADRGTYWYASYMPILGRLRPGVSRARANAELATLTRPLAASMPGRMPPTTFSGASLRPLRTQVVGDIGESLWPLLGAAALLLLIACVNVANLLRARAAGRAQEMALRSALGAGRGRLLRQRLAESWLLALAGGAAGAGLAAAAVPLLKMLLPANMPRLAEVSLDGRALAVALWLALLCGLAFGAWPAGRQRDARTRSTTARGRGGQRLVVIEVALSAMLVVAAGLTARSLMQLEALDPGFRSAGVLTAQVTPDPALCRPAARCQALYAAILDRVRALPGVRAAALVNGLPLGGLVEVTTFQVAAHLTPPGGRHPLAFGNIVTPGYFKALGIPLLRGRAFTAADMAPGAAPVVIVSQATAAKLWPGQPALGQLFKSDGEPQWRTVVGVVGDVRFSPTGAVEGFRNDGIYSPYGQPMLACAPCDTPPVNMSLVALGAPGAALTAAALQHAVSGAGPAIALSRTEPLAAWVSAALRGPRSTVWLFALAAALALVLGAVGLYGVLAYQVAGRRREIAIRMALGARRGKVLAEVAGEGLRLAAVGCLAGLGLALVAAQALASLLYGFNPRDPVTYAAVAGVWLLIAALASALPARRAARVDPARALRCE